MYLSIYWTDFHDLFTKWKVQYDAGDKFLSGVVGKRSASESWAQSKVNH